MIISKIPKSFKVLDIEVKVNIIPDLIHKEQALGLCRPNIDVIEIQDYKKVKGLTKEKQINTFYHELIHYVMYAITGEMDGTIDFNEQFVNSFSAALHQALMTMR